jgi:23S rRNA (guanosine2251-2'-O)-methyltransferase
MQKSAATEYLYGLNPAWECLRAGRRRIFEALFNAATADSPRLRKLRDRLAAAGVPLSLTDKGRLHQLCGSTEHQGVLLKVARYPYLPAAELYGAERLLLLDNVEDPHNVGAILRSADVFGFHDVLLPVRGVPEIYPSIAKVSAGAVEHLRIARDAAANRYAERAREAGFHIAALDAGGKVELRAFAATAPEKLLLVIGGEDRSVGQYILNMADAVVRLDQHGRINSLNASVAAGIAMFALAPNHP